MADNSMPEIELNTSYLQKRAEAMAAISDGRVDV